MSEIIRDLKLTGAEIEVLRLEVERLLLVHQKDPMYCVGKTWRGDLLTLQFAGAPYPLGKLPADLIINERKRLSQTRVEIERKLGSSGPWWEVPCLATDLVILRQLYSNDPPIQPFDDPDLFKKIRQRGVELIDELLGERRVSTAVHLAVRLSLIAPGSIPLSGMLEAAREQCACIAVDRLSRWSSGKCEPSDLLQLILNYRLLYRVPVEDIIVQKALSVGSAVWNPDLELLPAIVSPEHDRHNEWRRFADEASGRLLISASDLRLENATGLIVTGLSKRSLVPALV